MIEPDYEPLTAVEVIPCVYLARIARRQGNQPAARRWQAKADRWLARQTGRRSPALTLPRPQAASGP